MKKGVRLLYPILKIITIRLWHNCCYICIMKKSQKYSGVVQMYNSGMTIQELADHYCVTKGAMHQILKCRGCEFRPARKGRVAVMVGPYEDNEYRFRYEVLGMKVSEIAMEYGVSEQTIRSRIGPIRGMLGRGGVGGKVVEMIGSGMSKYGVARKLGISEATVRYWVKKLAR